MGSQCTFIKSDGTQCKRLAVKGQEFCAAHNGRGGVAPHACTTFYDGERRNKNESGYCQVDTILIDKVMRNLSGAATKVYLCLASHANNKTQEWTLARATIAEKCGLTTKTVDRALAELVEKNLIHIRANRHGNERTSSTYTMIHRRHWVGVQFDNQISDDQFKKAVSQWLYYGYGIENPNNALIVKERAFADIQTTIVNVYFELDEGDYYNKAGLVVNKLLASPFIREARPGDVQWAEAIETIARESGDPLDVLKTFGCTRYAGLRRSETSPEASDLLIDVNGNKLAADCMLEKPAANEILDLFIKRNFTRGQRIAKRTFQYQDDNEE